MSVFVKIIFFLLIGDPGIFRKISIFVYLSGNVLGVPDQL